MKLITVRETEDPQKSPDWLKQDPASGFYWVVLYRAGRGRLYKTTKERESKAKAIDKGKKIIEAWLGTKLDGGERIVTFSEAVDELYEQKLVLVAREKNRMSTLEQINIYFKKLKEEFGNIKMRDFHVRRWDQYVALFQKENPGKTLYNHWKYMSQILRYCHRMGYIETLPKLENPDPEKRVERVFTEEEKIRLLDVAPPTLRDQLLMAMTMGMRLREHLKLSWDRVDLKNKTIQLRAIDTKTKRPRTIGMSPQVYAMLLRRHAKFASKSPFVFPSRYDKTKPCLSNKKAWASAKVNAGITGKAKYHLLRHTFLTECAKLVRQNEVSIVLVCSYAGLSIRTFEKTYLHLNHEDTRPVANLIAVKLGESHSFAEVKH